MVHWFQQTIQRTIAVYEGFTMCIFIVLLYCYYIAFTIKVENMNMKVWNSLNLPISMLALRVIIYNLCKQPNWQNINWYHASCEQVATSKTMRKPNNMTISQILLVKNIDCKLYSVKYIYVEGKLLILNGFWIAIWNIK